MALNFCFCLSPASGQKTNILIISLSLSHAHTHTQNQGQLGFEGAQITTTSIRWCLPFWNFSAQRCPWLVKAVRARLPVLQPASFSSESNTPHCCVALTFFQEATSKVAGQDFWLRAISDVGHGSGGHLQVLPDAMLFPVSPLGEEKKWNPLRQWITNASLASL